MMLVDSQLRWWAFCRAPNVHQTQCESRNDGRLPREGRLEIQYEQYGQRYDHQFQQDVQCRNCLPLLILVVSRQHQAQGIILATAGCVPYYDTHW